MLALYLLWSTFISLRLLRAFYYDLTFIPNHDAYNELILNVFSQFDVMLAAGLDAQIPAELINIKNKLQKNQDVINNYRISFFWVKRLDITSKLFSILTLICLFIIIFR